MGMPSRGGPLEGVRVVELTKVWAGPFAGKYLAFLASRQTCWACVVTRASSSTNSFGNFTARS